MNQTNHSKSTMVVATLLAGAVFILSVTLQHWPSDNESDTSFVPQSPVGQKQLEPSLTKDEKKVIVVQLQNLGFNKEEKIIISFNEVFRNARESLGPGQIFEWNGNEYTTNRADDKLMLYKDSADITLDSISKESTYSVSIEITP